MPTPNPSILHAFAAYNRQANAALVSILSENPRPCLRDNTTHYGSILSLLAHISLTDLFWLRRGGITDDNRCTTISLQFSTLAEQPFDDLDEWWRHRQRLDAFIEKYTMSLTREDAKQEVVYISSSNRQYRQPMWQLLLHMFNHQTHHRGQIAQVLDHFGVENDFTNLILYLRD